MLLIRPRIIALKNRWFKNFTQKNQSIRDLVLLIILSFLTYSIYTATIRVHAIRQSNSLLSPAYANNALNLTALTTYLIVFFSSIVCSLSSFFLSKDLELIHASPIGKFRFFYNKLLEVVISSAWMIILFSLPVLVALGSVYNINFPASALLFYVVVVFFLGSVSLGILSANLISLIIPAKYTRSFLPVFFITGVIAVILLTGFLGSDKLDLRPEEIIKQLDLLSSEEFQVLPSTVALNCIKGILFNSLNNADVYELTLSCAIFLLSAYIFYYFSYFFCFSRAQEGSLSFKTTARKINPVFSYALKLLAPPHRAVLLKEFRLFARDVSQTFQLVILMGICVFYLYNFKLMSSVKSVDKSLLVAWNALLTICNIGMGAFVITALTARFVFPSISLEGKSYWILESAPLKLKRFLDIKFYCWLMPVSIIATVILLSGAMAINAEVYILCATAFISLTICYGIVALAIAFGACFANFEWDNTTQLTASLGSLFYMLASAVLIVINLLPFTVFILGNPYLIESDANKGFNWKWYAFLGICLSLNLIFNILVKRVSLNIAEKALSK